MHQIKFALILLISSSLFQACRSDGVELVDRNFTEEIPLHQNLRFVFNQDLVPDSVLGLWDSTKYVRFSPEIPGAFKWINKRELIFSPSGNYRPGQMFQAELGKEIVRYTKSSLRGERKLKFRAPYLKVSSLIAHWVTDKESHESFAKIDLKFNYEMEAKSLIDQLSVELDGKAQHFELQQEQSMHSMGLKLTGFEKHDDDLNGVVQIDKSIQTAASGENNEDAQFGFKLMSPYKVEVLNVSTQHDGEEGQILIYTTQALKSEGLSDFVSLKPGIDYKLSQEDDYISLKSASFDSKTDYQLTVSKGVMGEHGGKLRSDYRTKVSFGELRPKLQIANSDGMFLSAKGNRVIELNVTAVDKVRIKISKIYENNILSVFNGYYSPRYYHGYAEDDWEYEREDNSYYSYQKGDVIYDQVIETKNLPGNQFQRKLKLDLEDQLGDFDGIYHVHISSSENYWLSEGRFISISDLGIIAKHGAEDMSVFCNSIKDGSSIQGAEVRVFGKNNQLLGKGNSDGEGFVNIALQQRDASGFYPSFITVKKGTDFSFLPLSRTQVNTSRFDVGGKTLNQSGLECYIYPERDIYRPGETIQMAGILRNERFGLTDRMPLRLVLRMPNGNIFKELKMNLNSEGSFDWSQEIPKTAPTGVYQVEVSTFNNVLLGSGRILLEEFMPDRIKVKTSIPQKSYKAGSTVYLDLEAHQFFGPAAANRQYTVEAQTRSQAFQPTGYEDYNFKLDRVSADFKPKVYKGQTDAEGKAHVQHYIPASYIGKGKLVTKLFTTVFDENGRSVIITDEVEVFTQQKFIGLRSGSYYSSVGENLTFNAVCLDKQGKKVKGEVEIEVIRYEYRTVMERSGSFYNYRSQKHPITVSKKKVKIKGSLNYQFKTKYSGRYQIRIKAPSHKHAVVSEFYAYHSSYSSNRSFEVSKEGQVTVVANKENYTVGQTAKLLFKTPFNGRMLVTVEQDKVLKHMYVDVKNRSAEMSLKILDEHLPNVYVSATLFKAHTKTDMPLTVAHGYHSIQVEKPKRKLSVDIVAKEHSRSGRRQNIKVKTSPHAMVTIAVVDEGILQQTDFSTPDPYQAFYGKRALGVNSFDLYPYLFEEISYSSTAGGAFFANANMLNPVNSNRVNLVSYWSGLQQANSRGVVDFDVDLPQYSGDLRIMAVVHQGNRFGSAAEHMIISDPMVQSASVPRFLSIGDTLDLSLSLSNTTEKLADAVAQLEVDGPIAVLGASAQSVEVAPNSERFVHFKVFAKEDLGEAEIHFKTKALNETFAKDYRLPVRSGSARLTRHVQGVTKSNEVNLTLDNTDWLPSTRTVELQLGLSPLTQLKKDIQYLVRYPYGCLEQTVSSAFPQLYLNQVSELLDAKTRKAARRNVIAALDKLKLHTLYNGGFSYWPQHGKADWWATTYAVHFMQEAQKAGYEVDQRVLNRTYKFLQNKLKHKSLVDYYYLGGTKRQAPKEVAYSLYVLSLANKADKSSMNYYRMNKEDLSVSSIYLLAASYFISGDPATFSTLIPTSWDGEMAKTSFGRSYSSDLRDKAVILNALLSAEPEHPQINSLSKYILRTLNSSRYLNTQERAWSFLALGKMSATKSKVNHVEVIVDGKQVESGNFGVNLQLTLPANSKKVIVKTRGGEVFYALTYSGVSRKNISLEQDQQLSIRRSLYNRFGQRLTTSEFKQNDLIIVRLDVSSGFYANLENLAILDVLPAGFEIENSRLKDVPGMSWIKKESAVTQRDIRDDRVILFADVRNHKASYYYALRAVTKGDFFWASVNAECMYDGEVRSSSGGGMISIY